MDWESGPRLKKVYERDIDLILIEELHSSLGFREWFGRQLGLDSDDTKELIDIRHSVTDFTGESDIELGLCGEDGVRRLVLVENKIDAEFQDDQLDRYHDRGRERVKGDWTQYLTCLIAPERYLSTTRVIDTVDSVISYESIRGWFSEEESSRAQFKKAMFDQAIEKERRRTDSEVDEEVTQLHHQYWELVDKRYPQLGLDKPSGVAPTNHWIRFDPPSLPADMALYHKMRQGKVDLEFKGMANREGEFRRSFEPLLQHEMQIESAKSSLFVQIKVPSFTDDDIPEVREDGIQVGMDAANRLLEWYNDVSKGEAHRLELAIDMLLAADEDIVTNLQPPYKQLATTVIERGDTTG